MWCASGLYIIHYMLVPSRYDILYEFCTATNQSFLFVIVIRQGVVFSYFLYVCVSVSCGGHDLSGAKRMQDVLQCSYLLMEFLFWSNLTCKVRHASVQVMPLLDLGTPSGSLFFFFFFFRNIVSFTVVKQV